MVRPTPGRSPCQRHAHRPRTGCRPPSARNTTTTKPWSTSRANRASRPATRRAGPWVPTRTSDVARHAGTVHSILDAIGDTPLLEIDGVFAKLEFMNPSGSIKARIAHYMVEKAEAEGLLRPGDTIVEATSGNTGNALSMVAAVKGYRMLVVMPEGLSNERVAISRAYGAEIRFVGHFHVNAALEEARRLGQQP